MKIIYLTLIGLIIVSCSAKQEVQEVIKKELIPADIPELDDFEYDTLSGLYKGDFGGSEIRIILNYVSGSNAIGYNIHKGLQRNLNGSVERNGDTIHMQLSEPGDHEFDGVFELTFNGIDDHPTGSWVPINSVSLQKKSFELERVVRKELKEDVFSLSEFILWDIFYDSIGSYNFEEDGLCTFEYYPSDIDEKGLNQKVEINGSWSIIDEKSLKIEWQPNKIFRNRELVLNYERGEYDEPFLVDGDRTLHMMYY